MSSTVLNPLYETTQEGISEHDFKIVLWFGVGLCVTVCSLRFYIRFVSFGRLLVEDYLMLAASFILVSLAAVLQCFLSDVYLMIHVQNQLVLPGPDFPDRLTSALRIDGVSLMFSIVGIWCIKFNFLLFFRRFGRQIRRYMIVWWAAFVLVLCCGLANLGIIPYDCVFGNISHLTGECATESNVGHIYASYKASVAIDVFSDATIIGFPVYIIWRTAINLRQKIVLTGIFLLVGFTIAVSVVRGSIFGGAYKSLEEVDRKVLDTAWVLFWFYIEYIVSFIIACIISFRSLWVNKEQKAKDQRIELEKHQRIIMARQNPESTRRGLRSRWHRFHDSLLSTFRDLEGEASGDEPMLAIKPPSGRLSVDFSNWANAPDTNVKSGPATEHLESGQCSHSTQG